MAARLIFVAHAPTAGTREGIFGDEFSVLDTQPLPAPSGRPTSWLSAPEPACRETAGLMGAWSLRVFGRFADLDAGSWRGRSLADIAADDLPGLQSWLSDPQARPHGGESMSELIRRVGTGCDEEDWPDGRSVVVTSPLVVRAATVHALGVPAEAIFRLDVAPLGWVLISRSSSSWRLQELRTSERTPPQHR